MPHGTSVMTLLGAYLAMSIISFLQYGIDKRCAGRARRRLPEAQLLLVDLLCGWPGGLVGQQIFRHKTRKVAYQARYWIAVSLNVASVTGLYFGVLPP